MKILAVDDDAIILKLLDQIILALGGHELTMAESGAEALDVIAQNEGAPFDCFMFDIQMPNMDGIELVKRVRSIDDYFDTPVLMLTAMSDKRYIDRAFAFGATDYVTKPFEVSELETRLNLLQTLAQKRQPHAKKIFAAQALGDGGLPAEQPQFELYEPISIYDVENVIDHTAFENYLAQLSRSSLFGSTLFAFAIRGADRFFETLSPFEFCSLISDAAEVISDTMHGHQFLMSYAGNGIFVCVTESGWRPEMDRLTDHVNLAFVRTELYNNSGDRLDVRVVTGDAVRLVWKSGNSLYSALAEAHNSAEEAAIRKERERGSIWMTQNSA
ncbi:response regulator [Sulfitobacter sp. JBTF-M27]|uniref:Response regulator n=1 Tax=Sulfitobacter sediminilitoris TaxID=2698830 RepID=A0A6P0CCB1_9RHOB|nr:response regulator [Sulfitobacter sediminilitoris]NEK23812.1 response regulator [Sulfitobacter sediminilitoris]